MLGFLLETLEPSSRGLFGPSPLLFEPAGAAPSKIERQPCSAAKALASVFKVGPREHQVKCRNFVFSQYARGMHETMRARKIFHLFHLTARIICSNMERKLQTKTKRSVTQLDEQRNVVKPDIVGRGLHRIESYFQVLSALQFAQILKRDAG
jgi:hypothetical protein